MLIRSNPPGAKVYVDDYDLGTTPTAANFTYYGTRRIRLVKDGYRTLEVMQPIPPPWYQIPPLDFITDNFVPGEIRDQRTFDYRLVPQMVVPAENLLARGEELRGRATRAGGYLLPSAMTAPPPGPSGATAPPFNQTRPEVVPTPAPTWSPQGQPGPVGPALPGAGPGPAPGALAPDRAPIHTLPPGGMPLRPYPPVEAHAPTLAP